MKTLWIVAFALISLAPTCARAEQSEEGDREPGPPARSRVTVTTALVGGRVVGVGENLGRDKQATVLNYVLYGGRTYQADGRPTLLLHKIERTSAKQGLLATENTVRNSFIITYPYVQPDVIYLQGVWMKILEFDNTHLRFQVLEGRKPIGARE